MADAFQSAGLGARNYGGDTEHEAKPVRQGAGFGRRGGGGDAEGGTDLSRLDGLAKDMVIEQAIMDKLSLQAAEITQESALPGEEVGSGEQEAENKDPDRDGGNEDDELERLRAARRKQMKDRQSKLVEYKTLGHGAYDEIVEEEFLKTVTASPRCVVHFYHRQFEKCKIMDLHLKKMAPRFMGTRFVTLNAEKAPFFVTKLGIKTLPTLVLFINGVVTYKQVGFELLGESDSVVSDEFKTGRLARVLKEFEGVEEDFDSDDELLGSTK